MRLALFFMALCLVAGTPSRTMAQTAEERARLDWVEQRGRLIYDMDGAAWVGTDDALARIADARNQSIRGYIVERDGSGYAVTLYAAAGESPVAIYRGHVENRAVVRREIFPENARPPLTAAELRLVAARATALALDRRPCESAPFNTVVVPPDSADGPIDVYLLTPQSRSNEWPMGGHFRATVSAAGTVESDRAFTNSCLPMRAPENAAAMGVTHLLDPIPTELHVFSAFAARVPIFVGTTNPERIWAIESGRVRLVDIAAQSSKP